ncbi:4455_t:CDS:2 [Diversispora eburnea]|uniref:4455_t:CDS:1 n=1 Tax=Diversispora eburnea TaxID=1213867 RepID=A0A9N9B1N5_9GLOM|nr:4455_t:CDS:2 [Diversispora eburnea]
MGKRKGKRQTRGKLRGYKENNSFEDYDIFNSDKYKDNENEVDNNENNENNENNDNNSNNNDNRIPMPLCIPQGKQAVSPADRSIVQKYGLAVVDCSWARLDDIPFTKLKSPNNRLCECKAFAACFYITGFPIYAQQLLSKFKWGHSFFTVNGDLLNKYIMCKDSSEVVKSQNEWLDKIREEYVQVRENIDDDLMTIFDI